MKAPDGGCIQRRACTPLYADIGRASRNEYEGRAARNTNSGGDCGSTKCEALKDWLRVAIGFQGLASFPSFSPSYPWLIRTRNKRFFNSSPLKGISG